MLSDSPVNAQHDPYAAFRVASYRLYAIGYFVSVIGRAGVTVAVGYELYERTNSATALGLVGLVSALPVILFALPAGHLADRGNRKLILMLSQVGMAIASAVLMLLSLWHARLPNPAWLQAICDGLLQVAWLTKEKGELHFDPSVPLMLATLFLNSFCRTFGWAARGAFVANVVSRETLTNAVTWNSSLSQMASMIGPAIAGVVIKFLGLPAAYAIDVICGLIFLGCLAPVRHQREVPIEHEPASTEILGGLRFVWRSKPILGAITLDLLAVLVGGVTALLPIFAKEILHVGPDGLGWLRSAPAVGALVTILMLAHLPPMRRAGIALLWSVAGFGLATIVFGLSKSFALSFIALALTGALDSVSVVVRHSLVQLLAPDSMRGRVSAVNNVFINSSNDVGQIESGFTAACFGVVTSVVGGGIGVVIVVGLVAWLLPEVRRIGSLRDLKPTPEE